MNNLLDMKLVEPEVEIIPMPDANDRLAVLKHLETIGRVCYKSEEKITEESFKKFIQNIRDRKHWAMLEHFVFVMEVPEWVYNQITGYDSPERHKWNNDPDYLMKIKYINITTWPMHNGVDKYIISGSATSFNYLWECKCFRNNNNEDAIVYLCQYLETKYPELMRNPTNIESKFNDFGVVRFLSRKEIESLPTDLRIIHDTMTVRFLTDRGISHDLVRHRPASLAMESTRYINYGNKGFQFVIPEWISKHDRNILKNAKKLEKTLSFPTGAFKNRLAQGNPYELSIDTLEWLFSIWSCYLSYNRLLNLKWVPQQAKVVTEISLKTELYMTANLYEWRHFFKMRADVAVHPDMKKLAYPLLDMTQKKIPVIFNELRERMRTDGGEVYIKTKTS